MIIRENGIVVGMLDDQSLNATDVTSTKLAELLANMRKHGMERMQQQEEPLEKGQASGDAGINVPFTAKNIAFIETDLLAAGFDVQTA